ncbi:MAG: hypothetical protein HPY81_09345 [Firmicutes bacterium]|nr:hypothetical protein [Bacillota bacterium]
MLLRIDQIWGRLGLELTAPFLQIAVTHHRFAVNHTQPVLSVRPDRLELDIDTTAAREDLGLYDPNRFWHAWAAQGAAVAVEATAKIAEEGDRLAAIETGETDAIANIARENTTPDDEFDVGLVPQHPPEIRWREVPGEQHYAPGEVTVDLKPGCVDVELRRGVVRGYLRQPPVLEIRYVGGNVDVRV